MVFYKKKDIDKTSYLASQSSYGSNKHTKQLNDLGYILDEDLSSDKHKVYHDRRSKHTVIAFKGTNILDKKDIKSDINIAISNEKNDNQFKNAEQVYEKTRSKYGDKITPTGHSLGGTKANYIANKYDKKAIVFNPGTGLIPLKTPNSKVYNVKEDIISERVDKNDVIIDQTSWNPHTLSNYEGYFENIL